MPLNYRWDPEKGMYTVNDAPGVYVKPEEVERQASRPGVASSIVGGPAVPRELMDPTIGVKRPSGTPALPDMRSLLERVEEVRQAKGGVPGLPGQMLSKTMMGAALKPGQSIDPRAALSGAEKVADGSRLGADLGYAGNTIGAAIAGTTPDRGFYRQQLADAERGPERTRALLGDVQAIQAAKQRGESAQAALEFRRKQLEAQAAQQKAEQDFRDRQLTQQAGEGRSNRANAYAIAKLRGDDAETVAKLRGNKAAGPGGGKVVPAATVSDIANYQTAREALNSLEQAANTKTGLFSGMTQYIPGTDAAQYTDAQKSTAQVVGQILEGGKLSESDFPRYLAMMPTAGDSAERRAEKLKTLRQLIDAKERNTVGALGASGYATSGLSGGAPATPDASVVMISPDDGQPYEVDPSEVAEAEQNGWRRR